MRKKLKNVVTAKTNFTQNQQKTELKSYEEKLLKMTFT